MSGSIKRTALHQCLPLQMPLSVHVYPSFFCNFKCSYCLHSLDAGALQKKGFQRQYMDFEIFRKAVDDIAAQGWHLKAMIFAGHGEPLMHKQIAEMVAYAKETGITDRTEIVTNGSLLTHKLSDALIHAGLDRLRVSLQGVTAEQYQKTCGAAIDFDRFVEQLGYFYQHKTNTDVYIKIIDLAMEEEGDKERFETRFGPIADTVAVEYAIPFVPEIALNTLSGNSKQGDAIHSSICAMPFYMLVLYPNGDVLPCCATEIPAILGNITKESLNDIWNSRARIKFLLNQLDGIQAMPVCSGCSVPAFGLQEGDDLQGYQEKLKEAYQTLLMSKKGEK